MENLIACANCGSNISDTALKCPICWKDTGDKASLSKKVGMSATGAAATLLTGPAGVAAALVGGIFSLAANRELKIIAQKVGAIDSFYLTDEILILVTKSEFVIVLTGVGGPADFPGFLRSDLHSVYIDENKSKKGGFLLRERTVLHLDYFDTNYRKKEVHEDYKFKGKDSRAMAELALVKFKEYQLTAITPV
ncbi:MAG: hypothetical protein ACFFCW_29215 [Candidatus Hodarchaeota archaeon]